MDSLIINDNNERRHEIISLNNTKYFVKEYKDKIINIERLINEEYQKGKKLSRLINYPKPLRIEKNKIIFQYIDIKYSLYERLKTGKYDYNFIEKAAICLRKIHTNGIIHGDFNTDNIVITRDNKLYFIDASFSKYTNEYRVLFTNLDIYQDISLFLIFLKWIRPIFYKPWLLFLSRKKIEIAKKVFLNSYFQNNYNKFDPVRNAFMENKFLKGYLKYLREKGKSYNKIFMTLLIKSLIIINRWKLAKKKL